MKEVLEEVFLSDPFKIEHQNIVNALKQFFGSFLRVSNFDLSVNRILCVNRKTLHR
jgi:hypothetical protein